MNRNGGGGSIHPKVLNSLAKQQHLLTANGPTGVIFYPNEDGDVLDIQADILGPVGTPYHGGVFRCKLVVDSSFPMSAPKGYFLTKIYHPNVAQPSGDICVNTLKKDWNPAKWSLHHIFEVIRCLLIVPFPESSLNDQAGREFMQSYDDYFSHAKVQTDIHARPTPAQQELIDEITAKETGAAEKAEKQTDQTVTNVEHQQKQSQTQQHPTATTAPISSSQQSHEEENKTDATPVINTNAQKLELQVVVDPQQQKQQVLSQLTNSSYAIQENVSMQGQKTGTKTAVGQARTVVLKKKPSITDEKKKWMRRI